MRNRAMTVLRSQVCRTLHYLPTIVASSANGRALGQNTPPAMNADGTVSVGGPYDGIVTLNSATSFQFFRPTDANRFDAQRSIEQGIDEHHGHSLQWQRRSYA